MPAAQEGHESLVNLWHDSGMCELSISTNMPSISVMSSKIDQLREG